MISSLQASINESNDQLLVHMGFTLHGDIRDIQGIYFESMWMNE